MKTIKIILILLISSLANWSVAQNDPFTSLTMPPPNVTAFLKHLDVPVNLATGTPNISIPIHSLGQGDINIPISLNYNASGIRLGESASWVGMNWNLNVGGVIHRTVFGVPDEALKGYWTTGNLLEFEYEEPTHYTEVQIANGYWDGEPDLFSFSFPGYSGKFYINQNHEPVLVPEQDLKIEFTWERLNEPGEILQSFIITNPFGVKYHFGTNPDTDASAIDFIEFIDHGYNPYFEYPVAWHLTKIESQTHQNNYHIEYAKQIYEYHTPINGTKSIFRTITDGYRFDPNSTSSDFCRDSYSNKSISYVPFRITSTETNESVQFNANTTREDLGQISDAKAELLDRIDIRNSSGIVCKRFSFEYDYYLTDDYDSSTALFSDKRLRLLSLQESSCDGTINDIPPYTFDYTSNILPGVTSKAIDHWGYYNGAHENGAHNNPLCYSINIPPTTLEYNGESITKGNSNRDSKEDKMIQGVLKRINFPTGGFHHYTFEGNTYHDLPSSENILCGGLRIKSLEINSGDGTSPPIIKNYSYTKPNTTLSSGQLIQQPEYGKNKTHEYLDPCIQANPCYIWVTQMTWNEGAIFPLTSFEGGHIYYRNAKESFGDQSAKEAEFTSYVNPQPNAGRYPVIPQTYAAQVARLIKEESSSASNSVVSTTEYSYKRRLKRQNEILVRTHGVPFTAIRAVEPGNNTSCCDVISGAVFFSSTYHNYTGYSLIEEKNSLTDGIKSREEYEYRDDEKHFFPIKQKFLDPIMGSVVKTTEIKYPQEAQQYSFIASLMVDRHLIGVPIETRINDGDGGGSKLEYDLFGTPGYFKPIKYFQATSGGNYKLGINDTHDWKLMATANYSNGSDFPTSVKFRGNKLTTFYDWNDYAYGLLSKITLGTRSTSYTYNANRQLTSIKDPEGITSEITLDKIGRLTQSILEKTANSASRVTKDVTYSYQGENKIITTSSYADGTPNLTVEDVFDGLGRSIENRLLEYTQSNQDFITKKSYNELGLLDKECDPTLSGCTLYEYEKSPLWRITKITPGGSSRSISNDYGHTGAWREITTTDENGNRTSESFDLLGRKRKSVDGMGGISSFNYNYRDQVLKITPPGDGIPYNYQYFDDGLLKDRSVPDKGVYEYQYTFEDQIHQEVLPNATVLTYHYHPNYNSFLSSIVEGGTNVIKEFIPVNIGLSDRVQEEKNRILEPNGYGGFTSTQYGYDPIGLVEGTVTRGIDGIQILSSFEYDSPKNLIGELAQITGPDGTDLPLYKKDYSYPKGTRMRKTDLVYDDQSIVLNELNYNNRDQLISRTIGDNLQKVSYAYNGRGWLTKINSIQSTFDSGEGCTEPPNEPCFPTKRGLAKINITYNRSKIEAKTPTAIRVTIQDLENRNFEQIVIGEHSYKVPLNDFIKKTEPNPDQTKTIYLSEEMDMEQITLILEEEFLPLLQNYSEAEQNAVISALAIPIIPTGSLPTIPGKLFGMEIFYEASNSTLNASTQYNGNISWMKWRVKGEEVMAYGFQYDANNRLTNAKFGKNTADYCEVFPRPDYDVSISGYDARGNILGLTRNGMLSINNGVPQFGQIDDLTYSGYNGGGNLLTSVTDGGTDKGFKANSTYSYDPTGNLITDSGKGITNIVYNYLDLPAQIIFDNGRIENYYDASGAKIKSVIIETGKEDITRHHLGLADYKNLKVESVFNEEGRYVYERSEDGSLLDKYFEYNLKDHLGNTRVRFADVDGDQEIQVSESAPTDDELLGSYHYYPFGMTMEGEWAEQAGAENRYQYNGKELIEELDLGWLDYGARWYDPAIARWNAVDPLAESYAGWSPYNYVMGNPIRYIDPDGRSVDDYYVDSNGNYLGHDGAKSKDVRVISSAEFDKMKNTAGGTGSGEATEYLQGNSTKLSEYQEGIAISDGTWSSIEKDGGARMTASVQNNSTVDALVLPEKFSESAVNLNPGEGYYPAADGVSTAAMRADDKVYKMGDGAKVELTGSGSVKNVNWSATFWAGEKGASYLTKQENRGQVNWSPHPPQHAHYNHWARLYGKPMKSPNTLVPTTVLD